MGLVDDNDTVFNVVLIQKHHPRVEDVVVGHENNIAVVHLVGNEDRAHIVSACNPLQILTVESLFLY